MAAPRKFAPLGLTAMPGLLAICLIAASATGPRVWGATKSATPFAPASVHAAPGLKCRLHPGADESSRSVLVYTDGDGYARFYAMKAKAGDAAAKATLDCVDAAGKSTSYDVDLASEETFAPRPLDLSKEPGTDRPALQGDPLRFTQEQLISSGYGLRPDHEKSPAAYARWLESASRPGRILDARHPSPHAHNVTDVLGEDGSFWVGSVLSGAPNYISVEAVFNIPTAIAGGDQTASTNTSIWVEVGGNGVNGLIQAGVDMSTSSTVASPFGTWREYAGGDPDNNTRNGVAYGGTFTPSAGDQIFSQSWYCDSKGSLDLNGGYGCTHMVDMTSGAVFDCTSPNGSPCWSVKALPLCSVAPNNPLCFTLGQSAEFIFENEDGETVSFTDFTPKVTMSGSAYSSKTNSYSQTVSSDSNVILYTDGTNLSTRLIATLGSMDQTYFKIEQGQPSFGFYCQGPLKTARGAPPLTRFTWAAQGAGAGPPGQGECAWADRGPRGTEVKLGNINYISGYLNNFTNNLRPGNYMKLGVYNDPAADNDMVIKEPPQSASPPFPSNPSPP